MYCIGNRNYINRKALVVRVLCLRSIIKAISTRQLMCNALLGEVMTMASKEQTIGDVHAEYHRELK